MESVVMSRHYISVTAHCQLQVRMHCYQLNAPLRQRQDVTIIPLIPTTHSNLKRAWRTFKVEMWHHSRPQLAWWWREAFLTDTGLTGPRHVEHRRSHTETLHPPFFFLFPENTIVFEGRTRQLFKFMSSRMWTITRKLSFSVSLII